MADILKQFKDLWNPLGYNQKVSLVLASGVVVVAMVGLLIWAAQPNMQLLYGGLSADEAGKIVAKLEQKGINFETGSGGNSVYVEASKVHRLRMELATEGIPSGGNGPGFELFDEGSFGISDFVQRTNFLRAVQGELSRTIGQFDGVDAARVMVVMPENRIVVARGGRDRPTASVFVDSSGSLTLPTVNSVRRLVANAIQGLDINDVAVVDSSGVDWTEQLSSEGIGGLSNEAIRFRTKWESYFTNKVQTMLDRVLGPNQSEVRVAVDIDTSSVQTTETSYDPESQVARSTTIREVVDTETDTDGLTSGVAGVAANLPDGEEAETRGSLRQSENRNEEKSETYEINQTVSSRVQNPGDIRRLTASLLVAKRYVQNEAGESVVQPRTGDELQNLREIVINALGIKLARGQTPESVVTVQEMDFAPDPIASQMEAAPSFDIGYLIESSKGLLGLLLGVGVIVFFIKMLKKAKPEPISMEVLNPEQMLEGRKTEEPLMLTPDALNDLIRQKPGNVGVSLKEWMAEAEGATK